MGYTSLNPGPFSNPQLFKQEEWQAFSNIHLNINTLLLKLDKLRDIAKTTKPAMIGISESKLDSTVLDPEISTENLEILLFNGNWHRGVACYISYKLNSFLSNEIVNITFNILILHMKLITIGIIYRSPNQSKFFDAFEENLLKRSTSYHKIYFLEDFNINLFQNGKYVFEILPTNNKNLDSFTKKYHECCTLFGLKYLIKCPTSVTCNNSSMF